MQPRQTDTVNQFHAREADGYKAKGFTETESFMSMNRNEESTLPGITSVSAEHLSSCTVSASHDSEQ